MRVATIGPVKSLNGIPIGKHVPGPLTLSLIEEWNEMVGVDIVVQSLAHLPNQDKQQALGEWERLRSS